MNLCCSNRNTPCRNVAHALLRAASRLVSMPVPGDPR
jgi:hypothetical protein